MKKYFKFVFVFVFVFVVAGFLSPLKSYAQSNDMGICFLKVQKRTLQSIVNEVSRTTSENSYIQSKMKYFNGLKSLFVFVDTYNYKLFWVTKPSLSWLETNCFKYGYITDLDFSRRAITRVYPEPSNPMDNTFTIKKEIYTRQPAAAPAPAPGHQAPLRAPQQVPPVREQPVPPQYVNPQQPPQYVNPQNSGYQIPNITMNYYGTPNAKGERQPAEQPTKKETSSPVNVIVNNEDKKEQPLKVAPLVEDKKCVNYGMPDHYGDASYYFELDPLMAHEKVKVKGGGTENQFNMFNYGLDIKLGYRFNEFFNSYVHGRYIEFDTRSIVSPTTINQVDTSDMSYGLGVEHVASRFLRLALEYSYIQTHSFHRLTPISLITQEENEHLLKLGLKFNFIARDDWQLGLASSFGMAVTNSSEDAIYDVRTKLYSIKSFEGGHFGLSLGYERFRFKYDTAGAEDVNRHKFIFSLNYGFDI